MKIAYIHGFQSSSRAQKAEDLRRYLQGSGIGFLAPDFPDTPAEALECLTDFCLSQNDGLCLVGSSLGGFMAALLSARHGFRAALINPCVHPQRFCASLAGEQLNPATGARFVITGEMIALLEKLDEEAARFDPRRLLVLLQTGDEVLDYRDAERVFSGCTLKVTPGGCHAYQDFYREIPGIVAFFGAEASRRGT